MQLYSSAVSSSGISEEIVAKRIKEEFGRKKHVVLKRKSTTFVGHEAHRRSRCSHSHHGIGGASKEVELGSSRFI